MKKTTSAEARRLSSSDTENDLVSPRKRELRSVRRSTQSGIFSDTDNDMTSPQRQHLKRNISDSGGLVSGINKRNQKRLLLNSPSSQFLTPDRLNGALIARTPSKSRSTPVHRQRSQSLNTSNIPVLTPPASLSRKPSAKPNKLSSELGHWLQLLVSDNEELGQTSDARALEMMEVLRPLVQRAAFRMLDKPDDLPTNMSQKADGMSEFLKRFQINEALLFQTIAKDTQEDAE